MTHPLHILADRVEGLSGPDRELDASIWLATQPFPQRAYDQRNGMRPRGSEPLSRIEFAKNGFAPAYTASLDSAASLVPEGHAFLLDWGRYAERDRKDIFWEAYVQRTDDAVARGNAEANTPALAITAACLRARAIAANQESE